METMKKLLMTILRNKNTSMHEFRTTAQKLALILAQESANYLETINETIVTPLEIETTGSEITKNIILIPILRSGLALLPAFIEYYPHAKVGCVGLKRDEKTAIAHLYYKNLPQINKDDHVIILDPMLATGGSTAATLKILTDLGIDEEQMLFIGVICATEGLQKIKCEFPKVTTFIAAHDAILNDKKFIVPGLGDFGDRFFGTL
jgi:uracil phosphoribosyltransferase